MSINNQISIQNQTKQTRIKKKVKELKGLITKIRRIETVT
jgi:hypothetical protein